MPDQTESRIHAVVVDPRRLVREGVCALLSDDDRLLVSAAAGFDAALLAGADPVVLVLGDVAAPQQSTAMVRLTEYGNADELAMAVLAASCAGPAAAPARADSPVLTARERAVLRGLGRGLPATEIGAELGISGRTVERHRQSLMKKLGAANPARAVTVSLAQGLLRDVG